MREQLARQSPQGHNVLLDALHPCKFHDVDLVLTREELLGAPAATIMKKCAVYLSQATGNQGEMITR